MKYFVNTCSSWHSIRIQLYVSNLILPLKHTVFSIEKHNEYICFKQLNSVRAPVNNKCTEIDPLPRKRKQFS